MIPIEELKLFRFNRNPWAKKLLMIPIEELKPMRPAWTMTAICFWWYLLRNWNSDAYRTSPPGTDFWWYLLRNWNLRRSYHHHLHHPAFDDTYWGIETISSRWVWREPPTFDDTYWGIETNTMEWFHHHVHAFDDTYWGIETRPSCTLGTRPESFDDTYWGIETRSWKAEHELSKEKLLMIPIEELKRLSHTHCRRMWKAFDDTYWGIETPPTVALIAAIIFFWWYLLRNWNHLTAFL